MVSTNSLFDAASSPTDDHDMFSDENYEVGVMKDETKSSDMKMDLLLKQSQQNALARSGSRSNTPRNSTIPSIPLQGIRRPSSTTPRGRSSAGMQPTTSVARSITKYRSVSSSKRSLENSREPKEKPPKGADKMASIQREMQSLMRQLDEVTKENEANKQGKYEAEEAWETVKTIGEHDLTRMQGVVTHVSGKAAAA